MLSRSLWALTATITGLVFFSVSPQEGQSELASRQQVTVPDPKLEAKWSRQLCIGLQPSLPHEVALIAHRGDEQRFLENTHDAFISAARSGADYIETDIRMSADGVFLIHHDARTGRITQCPEGRLEITKTSWQTLHSSCRHIGVSGLNAPLMKMSGFLQLLKEENIGLVLDVKPDIKEESMKAFADELLHLDPQGLCQHQPDHSPPGTYDCFGKIIVYVNDLTAQNKLWRMAKNLEASDSRYHVLGRMKFLKILEPAAKALENPGLYLDQNGIAFKYNLTKCEDLHSLKTYHPDQYLAAWTLSTPEDFREAMQLGIDAIITSRIHDLVEHLRGPQQSPIPSSHD